MKHSRTYFLVTLFAATSFEIGTLRAFAQEDYKNPDLSADRRAEDLLSRLTLEEKARLMEHGSPAIKRLDIPQFNWWSEALHGVARNGTATVFPITVGMASSFNDELVEKVFSAASDEGRAKNNIARKNGRINQYACLSFWTPNINIFRDPRWGRGQETYGEDPFLTSRMGLSVVRGLQGPTDSRYSKLLACAKHYAVHSGPEWNRHNFDVESISARDLWETYLPAFKELVVTGGVKEVMCAYQRFEGEPCCGSDKLLQQILRNDWGFKGLVTSDCWAINDFWNPYPKGHGVAKDQPSSVSKAVISGTDLECGNAYGKNLVEAVKQGLISETKINESLKRLLKARFELGDFDSEELVEWKRIGPEVIASKEHKQLALDMARQSVVLLKNGNDASHPLLPLSKNAKVAVIGPNAADSVMLWGNYNGYPSNTVTILQGIRDKIGSQNVIYLAGCGLVERMTKESWYNRFRDNDGRIGMSASFWNTREMEGEPVKLNNYRSELAFDNGGATPFTLNVNLENFSARFNGKMTARKSENLTLLLKHTDCARIIINGDTIYSDWGSFTDDLRDKAIPFDVTEGKTYDIQLDYSQGANQASLHFDIAHCTGETDSEILAAVKDVDVVVFAGGISPRLEGEEMRVNYPGFKGGDRTDIELPKIQHDMIDLLHNAGKKIVFLNCSGSAMALVPEKEKVEAILQTWYAGEQGGTAIADILFGDCNPSAKLPVTFYKSADQLPDFLDYNMKGRTYRYFQGEPLWPFGYGLSYTTFDVAKAKYNGKDLKVSIQNTGKSKGTEVLQVYIRKDSDPDGPVKSLRGYKRVELNPGEKTMATIALDRSSFEFWDESTGTMRVVPGSYTIFYGTSSADKDLKTVKYTLKK